MADALQVPCSNCLAVNRVKVARLHDRPTCGRCKANLFPGQPVNLNDSTFARYVEASDVPVVVDFWAEWCGPCKAMAPQYALASRANAGRALFAKVDTEAAPSLSARFEIRSIPSLIVFKRGSEIARQAGAMAERQISGWLAPYLLRTEATRRTG